MNCARPQTPAPGNNPKGAFHGALFSHKQKINRRVRAMAMSLHQKKDKVARIYKPAGTSRVDRARRRFSLRRWSVSHARFLESFYTKFADVLVKLHWLWEWIGYERVERPMLFVEKGVKGLLFDCRMCGECVLSDTGMSCPMNCPKSLRNGPCGGVRENGNCEVEPDMPCVWVEAWRGAQTMRDGERIMLVQKPVDQSLQGSSAWLRSTARHALQRRRDNGGAVK